MSFNHVCNRPDVNIPTVIGAILALTSVALVFTSSMSDEICWDLLQYSSLGLQCQCDMIMLRLVLISNTTYIPVSGVLVCAGIFFYVDGAAVGCFIRRSWMGVCGWEVLIYWSSEPLYCCTSDFSSEYWRGKAVRVRPCCRPYYRSSPINLW